MVFWGVERGEAHGRRTAAHKAVGISVVSITSIIRGSVTRALSEIHRVV